MFRTAEQQGPSKEYYHAVSVVEDDTAEESSSSSSSDDDEEQQQQQQGNSTTSLLRAIDTMLQEDDDEEDNGDWKKDSSSTRRMDKRSAMLNPLMIDDDRDASSPAAANDNEDDDDAITCDDSAADEDDNDDDLVRRCVARCCPNQKNIDFYTQAIKFGICFCGLQASYLTWGYMQELIMSGTHFAATPLVPNGMFPSATFCVFSNRCMAVWVAAIAVRIQQGAFWFANNNNNNNNTGTPPLLAFTPCAASNSISSWAQYASLKYVPFPVQTVFKSSKIIPVMLMGKLLKGTSYPWGQYGEAFLITAGVAVFSVLSKKDPHQHDEDGDEDVNVNQTQLLGLICLLCYICFDSFTAQWQDKLYTQYGRSNVTPYQMMLGVNISAVSITAVALLLSRDMPAVVEFLQANPAAARDIVIMSCCSATGQSFIFYTISEFGPVVFTVIMTTRQMFSICLSAVLFGHDISPAAACGAVLVFAVLFFQIRRKYLARRQRHNNSNNNDAEAGGSNNTCRNQGAGDATAILTTSSSSSSKDYEEKKTMVLSESAPQLGAPDQDRHVVGVNNNNNHSKELV